MSINTIDDVIKTLNVLKSNEILNELFDEDYKDDFNVNVINTNYIDDDDLREEVIEIELGASHFFLDPDGLINKAAQAKLNKNNYQITKLKVDYDGMSHSVGCSDFIILFENY
jgi:hypothetical protein